MGKIETMCLWKYKSRTSANRDLKFSKLSLNKSIIFETRKLLKKELKILIHLKRHSSGEKFVINSSLALAGPFQFYLVATLIIAHALCKLLTGLLVWRLDSISN